MARRLAGRDDSGQVIVIVLILVVLLAALGPVLASQVAGDGPLLVASTNKHAALAAAEAGMQWYRDEIDSNPDYFLQTTDTGGPLSGYCSSACDLGGTSPQEAFHYVADDKYLFGQTTAAAGRIVLTVTGRAGSPGSYAYVTAETTLSPSSVLQNAYFSDYEVLDPNSDTAQGLDVQANGATVAEVNMSTSYCASTSCTPTELTSGSLWSDLCAYETYSPNTFVDAVGTVPTGGSPQYYSASYPYYGPYFGQGFSFSINGSDELTSGGATSTPVDVPSQPCGDPYDFVTGENFDGPVYSNDQLHICGSPSFAGAPVSLVSGAPNDVPYLWDVPGSVQVRSSNSGSYPGVPIGDYVPAGYTSDQVNCSGGPVQPILTHGVELGGSESLPSLNTNLAQYATSSPPSTTVVDGTGAAYGCTYEGPTAIELVTAGATTTMDVWSPLSSAAGGTTSSCSGGGTFSAAHPMIDGIALPTDGVVYVEDYTLPTDGTLPKVPADGSAPCFNPYRESDPATSAQCYEGDVYIEGELSGQLTVGSTANIVVTRDLTDACADTSGGAQQTDPSAVAACTSSTSPDVLGLSAKYDVLVSGNDPSDGTASDQSCTANGFGDGTGTPVNTPTSSQTSSRPYTSDPNAGLANDPAAVWPTLCNPTDIVIDAAVFALNGSFGVENWGTTALSGGAYLNGADLSYYRGPFGYVGSTGYEKEFSFDERLQYTAPPHSLQSTVAVWQVGSYVVCGTSETASSCPAYG